MRLGRPAALLAVAAVTGATFVANASSGDADESLTVPARPGTAAATWTGTIPQGGEVLLVGDPLGACSDPSDPTVGDQHTVDVVVPGDLDPDLDVTALFSIDWDSAADGGVEDEHLVVLGPDGRTVAESDTGGQTYESAAVTLVEPGTYTVVACPFQNPTPKDYTGTVTLITAKRDGAKHAKGPSPSYAQLTAPEAEAADAGEPSIGNNWNTDATLFQAGLSTYRVDFDDSAPAATWTDVSAPLSEISLDPILFTDSTTGRTFESQLLLACSSAEFTDDDGGSWAPSEGCGAGTGIDHQTIGGGPFPPALQRPVGYPHAVYYCTNGVAAALCASSQDGGVTFGPAVAAITDECGVLHGHLRVGPEGTVYLPASNCQGKQGVSVSTDGGLTWTVHTIPDSIAGTSDPSVATGSDGTVYFGYADGSGKPKIAVSTDHGETWSPSTDVGFPLGINSTEFSEVIAGDGDRAAFAFLGTPTEGSYQSPDFGKSADGTTFEGAEWHLYVATTYDRGATWTTVDATPTDPVQRGCIWNGGGSSKCRNLLDFNDITIDKVGRVMVGFADGCTGYASECPTSSDVAQNKYESHGAVVRQLTGRTLFAEYDGLLPGSGKPPKDKPHHGKGG